MYFKWYWLASYFYFLFVLNCLNFMSSYLQWKSHNWLFFFTWQCAMFIFISKSDSFKGFLWSLVCYITNLKKTKTKQKISKWLKIWIKVLIDVYLFVLFIPISYKPNYLILFLITISLLSPTQLYGYNEKTN
jgi:hypothetical protein